MQLDAELRSNGYDVKAKRTRARKLLSRLLISVSTDDPNFPLVCIAILRTVALNLDSSWPQRFAIGYAVGQEGLNMPGRLTISVPILNAARKLGRFVGTAIKWAIS